MVASRRAVALVAALSTVVAALTLASPARADGPSVTSLAVPGGPVAVATDGSTTYTAAFDGDSIAVISAGALAASIEVGDGPSAIAVDGARSRAYVTNYYDGTLSVINTASRGVVSVVEVGNFPSGVAVSPDGAAVYVANLGTDSVSVIVDGDTASVIPVDSEPIGVAAAPDGSFVAVTNSHADAGGVGGSVSLIDTATRSVTATVPVGNNPTGLAISADSGSVYVANTGDGSLSVIDAASASVVSTVTDPRLGAPMGVDLAANEHAVYVTNSAGSTVVLVDPDSHVVLETVITVGLQPRAIAAGDDGRTAYVADYGSQQVSTISWPRPQVPPGPPTAVTATAGILSATVSWTPPADAGTSAITAYTVSTAGGLGCTTLATGPQPTTCTVTGLPAGVSRTFTVTATSAVGVSDPSAPSNPVTPLPSPGPGPQPSVPPGPPTDVTASAGVESATLSWVAPADPGSSAVQYYIATGSPGGDTCRIAAPTSSRVGCTVTGLTPGIPVTFTVRAFNATDASVPSSPSDPVTPDVHPGAPSAPRSVVASVVDGTIVATWQAPADDGHSPITGYQAVAQPGWTECDTTGATTCTFEGLTPGRTYRVIVTASNDQGTSPASDPSAPVTIDKQASIAKVSGKVGIQSFQRVLLDPGVPSARLRSRTTSTCVVKGATAIFVAAGTCRLSVTQEGWGEHSITTTVAAGARGTSTALKAAASIAFAKGSAKLTKAATRTLSQALPQMRKASIVTVVGYGKGALGRERAAALAAWLRDRGVTPMASTAVGQAKDSGLVNIAPGGAA